MKDLIIENSFNKNESSNIIINEVLHKIPKELTINQGLECRIFIGRKKEMSKINKLLEKSNNPVLLNGIGGIGKSSLASHYLHKNKKNYDYFGYINSSSNIDINLIHELKSTLDLSQENSKDAFNEAIFKLRNLEGRKLIIFDDLKNIEEQKHKIQIILNLSEYNYKIILTSREIIDDVNLIKIDNLNEHDAISLFDSIYEIKDKNIQKKLLENLDYHTYLIEITAKTLKNKPHSLTPEIINNKFNAGQLTKINVSHKKSFNLFLKEVFTLDYLDKDAILLLKKISVLPPVFVSFTSLELILNTKKQEDFEDLLNYLHDNGWLIHTEKDYKLHQIIKEFILENHSPSYDELYEIIDFFENSINKITDISEAIKFRKILPYLFSISDYLIKIKDKTTSIATLFDKFGRVYLYLGEYVKALELLPKSLEILENELDEYHFSIAVVCNSLGLLYYKTESYDLAISTFEKELKALKHSPEDHRNLIAISYNNLAEVYRAKASYNEAALLYKKSLLIKEEIFGKKHYSTATAYNNLAEYLFSIGDYDSSIDLYKKALQIRKKVYGENHSETAQIYNNLAEAYKAIGDIERFLKLSKEALNIRENILGSEHLETAQSYNNLAIYYNSIGHYNKSLQLHKKSLKIKEKMLGKKHTEVAATYNNMASLHSSMKDYEEALLCANNALLIYLDIVGNNHPNTALIYNNLAIIYANIYDFKNSYDNMLNAIKIWERTLPSDHPNLIAGRENLTSIKKQLDLFDLIDEVGGCVVIEEDKKSNEH